MTIGLTPKQMRVLRAFCALSDRAGPSRRRGAPSYDDLAGVLNICSRGNVGRYIEKICERGWLAWRRDVVGNRELVIVKRPPAAKIEITQAGYAAMQEFAASETRSIGGGG